MMINLAIWAETRSGALRGKLSYVPHLLDVDGKKLIKKIRYIDFILSYKEKSSLTNILDFFRKIRITMNGTF